MRICKTCLTQGALTRQAFTPEEINFLVSATISMLGQAAAAPPEEQEKIKFHIAPGWPSLRKLFLGIPEPVRNQLIDFFEKQSGLTLTFTECEPEIIASEVVH